VLLALGLTGLFLTGDVFSFYVFFELAMISSYALASVGGGARQTGAAFIFAVVNLLGSFIFLIAVAALYRVTGTLEMGAVAERMAQVEPTTAILIAVSFFVAFGTKLGLFPFHFWLPAVYAAAPPAIGAMLAGALANIGAYGLLRFGAELLSRELELAAVGLVVLGTLSIVYGGLQAVSRRDTREVLAYSSIGQAGYVLVALGIGGPVGLAAAVVFSVANSLTKALLFVAAEMRGPLVAAAAAVGAFSVAGLPPTVGFFGKAALFEAGIEHDSIAIVVLLFAGSALSFIYMMQLYQHDHWRPGTHPDPDARPATPRLRVAATLLALVVLGVGLWPEPLLAVSERAADALGAAAR
jgi:multicomponent Na+:H+ antiporter subunit D